MSEIATITAKVMSVGGPCAQLDVPVATPHLPAVAEVRLPLSAEQHQALGHFLYRDVEIVVRRPGQQTWDEIAAAARREKLELRREERDGYTVEVQLLWTVGITAGQPLFILRTIELGPQDAEVSLRAAAAAAIANLRDETATDIAAAPRRLP